MSVQIDNLLNLKKNFEFSFLDQQMCPLNKVNAALHHNLFLQIALRSCHKKKERSSLPLSQTVSESELILDYLAWSSNPNDNNKVLLPIYWTHTA